MHFLLTNNRIWLYLIYRVFTSFTPRIMKTHKTKSLSLNLHTMKKVIHKKLHAFGSFYRKHWKVLVGAKLILLAIILTFTFSMWNDIGNVVRHSGIPTYANAGEWWPCGDKVCESISAYCKVSNTDCAQIKVLSDCGRFTWCSIHQTVDVLSCSWTTFSCSSINDATSCQTVWCTRSGEVEWWTCTNDDGKGGQIDETCSPLKEPACKAVDGEDAGDCKRSLTRSQDICRWTMSTPKTESNCTTLQNMFVVLKIGSFSSRYPDHIEDEISCPADCSAAKCGDSVVEWNEVCDDGMNANRPWYCNNTCDTIDTTSTSWSCAGYDWLLCSDWINTSSGWCENIYSTTENTQCKLAWDGLACTPDTSKPCDGAVCGNSTKEWAEECDDGNTNDRDGCSSMCTSEISPSTCGNGQVEWDEECDDRNTTDGDGCSQNCYREPSCSISMTWATNESPFTAYFTYELYATSAIDYMQFDGNTTGDIEDPVTEPDVLWTFTHEYAQLDTINIPQLLVYNNNHPELTSSCSVGIPICTPFTPDFCGSGALDNRWFQCTDIPQSECLFLIEIYQATSGDNRDNNNGWLQDPEACDRHGVTCTTTDDGTFLESLNLVNNNLQGQLPATVDLLLPYLFGILNPVNNESIPVNIAPVWVLGWDATPKESMKIITGERIISNTNLIGFGSGGKGIRFSSSTTTQDKSFSKKINLGGFDFSSIPFLHFTTLNLSRNHLWWTIPIWYTLVFPVLETLNFSYNDFSSVFGQEPLVSIPSIPWYTEYMDLATAKWYGEILGILNNISFTSNDNFRPYFVFNFMTQRFDLDHALATAIAKDSLDTLSALADIMWAVPDDISPVWSDLYKYYWNNLLPIPEYMKSTADYTFNSSQTLESWFLIDLAKSITEPLKDEEWKFSWEILGNTIGENQDILDNVVPLITSMIQQFTNIINHLKEVNFSHNSITTLPSNLPLNACINSFDLSYNQLNKGLPFVSYFWYNKWPVIQAEQYSYKRDSADTVRSTSSDFYAEQYSYKRDSADTVRSTSSDFYSELVQWGIGLQAINYLKHGEILSGTNIGVRINDEKVTTIITDHWDFSSQIVIPDTIPAATWTVFGKNCIQSPINGSISCENKDCTSLDPECVPLSTGAYIWIFAVVGDDIYSSVCAYSGSSDGIRSYDPDDMTFDKDDVCASLGMRSLYDFNILRQTIGEPLCDRTSETITLDLSHNQLVGYLPEIVTTNSTTRSQLQWLTLWQNDQKSPTIVKWPLRLFMQSNTPVTVDARLNDNNLTDDRQPDTRTDITEWELTNNCLTRPGLIDAQTTYLENFREGWDDQRMCDLPWITYSPDQKNWRTDTSVTATVHLPDGWFCSIINNNWDNTYTFDTNGAFAFEVNCSGFSNPWFLIWKVNRITSNTTILVNAKDFAANLDVYDSNTKDDDLTSATTTLINKKKMIARAGMKSIQWVNGAEEKEIDTRITTTNNLNFINDTKVYNPLTLSTQTGTIKTPKISVDIPKNVVLKSIKDGTQTDYTKIFYAPQDITDTALLTKFLSETQLTKVINVIHVWSKEDNSTVIAQNEDTQTIENFTLTIETAEPVGKLGKIFSSQDGNSWTYYGTSVVIASWTTNIFYLKVPHLTYFGIWEDGSGTIVTTWSETSSGIIVSNGSMKLIMDYCPDGDDSLSYYDNTCVWVIHSWTVSDTIDTNELRNAYFYALDRGLISTASADARLYDKIRRRDLAKLIAIYAKNVVWLVPSTTRNCAFTDLSKETIESKAYIMRACRLGIMWVHKDGDTPKVKFDPNNLVTRAEFATVLSRLLYDGTYNVPLNSTYQWYELHMRALKAKWVIKNISQPRLLETKWFVLIMLQRADELIINAWRKK